ncbi:helicase associated domain-containing protein [Streptomyces sp. NPDC054865]
MATSKTLIDDQGFAENLAAMRAYYELHGTRRAPRHATMPDRAVGQWLTNIRRPDGARRGPRTRPPTDRSSRPSIREKGWTVD